MLSGGYAALEREYDDAGRIITERYYGTDGQQSARKEGYDELRQTWNEQNKQSRIEYWLGGEPFLLSGGYAALEREYDEKGNMTLERYYGTDGQQSDRKEGYDELRQTFNEQNKPVRIEYRLSGEPFLLSGGYAALEREYDEAGRIITERYYNADGQQSARKEGYDELRQTWNEQNKQSRIEYRLGGELFMLSGGYAALEREYDEKGNMTLERYYGTDGQQSARKEGYDELRQTFNEQNKPARIEYWLSGEPFVLGAGYAAIEREYDEAGRISTERYYGPDGQQSARKEGYDELHQTLNEQNRAVWLAYYLNGEPFYLAGEYAAADREYDAAGNITYEKYYDGEGQPIARKQGYGEIRKEYNEKKQVVFEAWYDTDGKPMTMNGDDYYGIRREYDENGLANVLKYLDADGEPMNCRAGYEMVWRRFNEEKRVNYESYMKADSTPMANVKGVYQTTYDYDEQGRIIRELYFGADGQSMTSNEGFIAKEWTFDEAGNKTETGIAP